MTLDVSVVVPVYDPGPHIETCIEGYLNQSMPAERREIIFVDDGSTDDTPRRLDELAEEHPDVRVIHQPNSGWPGKPRNVGIDAAHGDYVFFHDHDDWLGPEALDRMVAMARRTDADVLVPKLVGHGRPVPRDLYRENIDRAVLGRDPLMTNLRPHKLLRRGFMSDHGLRFREGRRRLEDHVFVLESYLAADVISVLSDYPCYHHTRRDDGGNAADQRMAPAEYYRYVAEVVDVIESNTEPGELRDELLQRPLEREMLGRLMGPRFFVRDDETRAKIFGEVRRLVTERFPKDFPNRLPVAARAHARALVENRIDRMAEVAARTASTTARARLSSIGWESGRWVMKLDAEAVFADGSPIRLVPDRGGWALDPQLIPVGLIAAPCKLEDLTADADVMLRDDSSEMQWYPRSTSRPELVPIKDDSQGACRLIYRINAVVDPVTVAVGHPLRPGRWMVVARLEAFGIRFSARVNVRAGMLRGVPQVVLLPQRRAIRPRRLESGNRSLAIDAHRMSRRGRERAARALAEHGDLQVLDSGDLAATVDLPTAGGAEPVECRVILTGRQAAAAQRGGELNPTAAIEAMVGGLVPRSPPAPGSGLRVRWRQVAGALTRPRPG